MENFKQELRKYYQDSPKHLQRYFCSHHPTEMNALAQEFGTHEYGQLCYLVIANLTEIPKCPLCKKLCQFHRLSNGYFETCGSKECKQQQRIVSQQNTLVKFHGVTNVAQLQSAKDRTSKTNIVRYGHKMSVHGVEIKDKAKETMLERYGVESPLQSAEIQERRKATMIETFGTDSGFDLDSFKVTMMKRYGVECASQCSEIQQRAAESNSKNKWLVILKKAQANGLIVKTMDHKAAYIDLECGTCHNTFQVGRLGFNARILAGEKLCWICHPENKPKRSKAEFECFQMIKAASPNLEVLQSKRFTVSTGKKMEIDLYIPSLNLGIEYNGIFWHSTIKKENEYHRLKSEEFKILGIDILHVWEDNWNTKRAIVESMIKNRIGIHEHKIGARECELVELTNAQRKTFFESSHLSGDINASHAFGLMWNGTIVAAASFGRPRFSKTAEFELYRFALAINHSVRGALPRLISAHVRHFGQSLMTYKSLDFGLGESVYERNGFTEIKRSDPSFFYSDGQIRYNRMNFQKKNLLAAGADPTLTEEEIAWEMGYWRVWDCGNSVLVYDPKNLHKTMQ